MPIKKQPASKKQSTTMPAKSSTKNAKVAAEVVPPAEVAPPSEVVPMEAESQVTEAKPVAEEKPKRKPRAKKAETPSTEEVVEASSTSNDESKPEGNGIFGKNDIVEMLHKKHPEVTVANLKRIVDSIFDEISTKVANGTKVKIHNFGSFQRRLRQARVCNHPKDKATKINVPASFAVGFEVFAKFKTMVKEIPVEEAQPATTEEAVAAP